MDALILMLITYSEVIQGTVEVGGEKLSTEDVADSVEFCMRVIRKVNGTMKMFSDNEELGKDKLGERTCDRIKKEELKSDLNKFRDDIIHGMTVNLQQGALGLIKAASQIDTLA